MGARVRLYSRKGCRLCDEVRRLIERVGPRFHLELEIVDIDSSDELRTEFNAEVPVVEINDREIARHRLTEERLVAALMARN